jgi:hypothetical protein
MTTTDKLRAELVTIFGLEVAPNGEPDFLLIRDENGTVLEGVSYADEIDQAVALFTTHLQSIREAELDKFNAFAVSHDLNTASKHKIYQWVADEKAALDKVMGGSK